MRQFILLLVLGMSNVLLQPCKAQSPNVIFILIDDQGWNGTSHQMDNNRADSKSDYYQTPNVERLAQAGTTFSQAYAPAPKCSPTRNSILTGQSTAKSLFTNTTTVTVTTEFLLEPSSTNSIDNGLITFPELVKQENPNYMMAHYGKWHLGAGGPSSHGFDRSDGNTGNNDGDHGGGIQADPKKIFSITDSALAFINDARVANRPFYLQLSHYAVHSASELTQARYDTFNTPSLRPIGTVHNDTLFAGMTEDIDQAMGYLLDSITAWGLDANTYIVYMADNGASTTVSRNRPLTRGKIFLTEGGIRVPLIIKGPNISSAAYNTTPVIGYDLYATFVDWMLGNTNNIPSNVDGTSLKDLLVNTTSSINRNNSLIFHSPHYASNASKKPVSAIRNDSFKLVVDYELGQFYLYDMINDIEEAFDVKTSYPEVFSSLCLELRDYLKNTNADMPNLNPADPANNGPIGDLDNDGLDDRWEFSELLTHSYVATDDPDLDGFDNQTEYVNGTDPYVANNLSSISSSSSSLQFDIFPNPSTDLININTRQSFDKVLLYDASGQKIIRRTQDKQLHVKNLSDGLYFIVLKKDRQVIYSQEIIIAH